MTGTQRCPLHELQKQQQKSFKEYWKKCLPCFEEYLEKLRGTLVNEDRIAACLEYNTKIDPFYAAYRAYLVEIGYDYFGGQQE